MKKTFFALLSLASTVVFVSAQTVLSTTSPVGFIRTNLLATSDSFAATTLARPAVFVGAVDSATANSITVAGAPNWSPVDFPAETFYVRIGAVGDETANPFEGRIFKVLSAGNATLVLENAGESLASVPSGAKIEVIPHWTLDTFFPAEDKDISFLETTNTTAPTYYLALPSENETGINVPNSNVYFYNNGAWRKAGAPAAENYGDTILPIGKPFIVRNTQGVPLQITHTGAVVTGKIATPLFSKKATKQDNKLTSNVVVPVSLKDLNLIESGVFTPSASIALRKDELYVYDMTRQVYNRSAAKNFYFYNGAWRQVGQAATLDVGNTTLLQPGEVFILRKTTSAADSKTIWTQPTTY